MVIQNLRAPIFNQWLNDLQTAERGRRDQLPARCAFPSPGLVFSIARFRDGGI
jgi:hypothetical protein